MYIVINGKINNFLFSLNDYLNRNTSFIKRFDEGTFIWGVSRVYSVEKPGSKILLYLSMDEEKGFNGGIVLSGEIKEIGELKEKYWPEGEWPHYIALKVRYIPRSVIEEKDPKKWKYASREKLKELFNFRPLPGIQKLDDKIGEEIEKLLKN
ncbi:hypothetical protein [Sulfurisphaera ohwakuensis]|uniref:EVE domain-containing protein n=1 Tax=Sulfurisphaera ohwakuensis TaxID=69656 RepID=A0A650CFC5_SULOH|nr:hypothetical protein [Sulfurisphaera ohwakuensis]MBB5254133.1 hypothetical protein [Sulfurisphaera ohwakuensis]QGR16514.1 hypothetical protein D1869_04350 [Sulfurisphaera ohwakuensis]